MRISGKAFGCGEAVTATIEVEDKRIRDIEFTIEGPSYLKEEARKIKEKLIGKEINKELIKDMLINSERKYLTLIAALHNALNKS